MKKVADDVILSAAAGNQEALQQILKCYEGYINVVSSDLIRLSNGKTTYIVNEDKKSYIQLCLIDAIKKWRISDT